MTCSHCGNPIDSQAAFAAKEYNNFTEYYHMHCYQTYRKSDILNRLWQSPLGMILLIIIGLIFLWLAARMD